MRKMRKFVAPVAALSMVLAACGGDDDTADDGTVADDGGSGGEDTVADDGSGGEDTVADDGGTTEDTVDATQGSDLTFHMITHSDDGPFWSVVKRGMDQACADLKVDCVWLPSNNDPEKQVQDIDSAVAEGSNGIASSLPSPDQLVGPLQAAVAAGIPVITLNSGVNDYQTIGALTHVGQTETIAGNGAGERFNDLGATKILCGIQEQSNVALEERCQGLEETFNGEVVTQFMGLDADQTAQQQTINAAMSGRPDDRRLHGHRSGHRHVGPARRAGPRSLDSGRWLRHHSRDHRCDRRPATSPSPSTSSSTCRATCRSCSCS